MNGEVPLTFTCPECRAVIDTPARIGGVLRKLGGPTSGQVSELVLYLPITPIREHSCPQAIARIEHPAIGPGENGPPNSREA